MGQKPAFPPNGQGVQRVTHSALEQIAEQQLGHQEGVSYIDGGGCYNQTSDVDCQIIRSVGNDRGTHDQQHKDAVKDPGRCEPGQILHKKGFVKERCF